MIISFVGGHVPMQAGGLAPYLPLMSVLKEGQNNLQVNFAKSNQIAFCNIM